MRKSITEVMNNGEILQEKINAALQAGFSYSHFGACRDDPHLFYSPDADLRHPELKAEREWRVGVARTICDSCPVEVECLEGALERREKYGIWGGKTERERGKILAEHTRPMRFS